MSKFGSNACFFGRIHTKSLRGVRRVSLKKKIIGKRKVGTVSFTAIICRLTGPNMNKRINLLPWEKCEEHQSRPIRNRRWNSRQHRLQIVVEYIPKTIMKNLSLLSCECRRVFFAKKCEEQRAGSGCKLANDPA